MHLASAVIEIPALLSNTVPIFQVFPINKLFVYIQDHALFHYFDVDACNYSKTSEQRTLWGRALYPL